MKLQLYKQKELTFKIADTASISISKSGNIVLNSAAIFLLDIDENSKVILAQDTTEKSDWFIAVDNTEGVSLKKMAKTKLGWQGKSIANKIIGLCNVPDYAASVIYRISEDGFGLDGLVYYPIITLKPIRISRAKS